MYTAGRVKLFVSRGFSEWMLGLASGARPTLRAAFLSLHIKAIELESPDSTLGRARCSHLD